MEAARNLRGQMADELKGKLLYLKLDCATRLRTNYLGINARFVDDQGRPRTWTLALVDTRNKHGGRDLKDLVAKV